ncbi:MAG: hypothetical protein JNN07_00090 [Verrucomicrobiales bacterium]|nr:hypothetical protein [Verrucomicrobiales bacterium]
MNFRNCIVLASCLVLGFTQWTPAQHIHISAGALAETPGSRLSFDSADAFVTNSGYVINLAVRTAGPAVGLFDGGPTFTALAIAPGNGGPDPNHALPGSRIALQWVSLQGPQEGSLSFWESKNCEDAATEKTFTFRVGETNPSPSFLLSQNSGAPGSDPYGHCHGRRFTTDVPGLYTLGVRLLDVSTNGSGAGPVHQPSETNYLHFQAGITIHRLEKTDDAVTASFGTRNFGLYSLESSPSLTDETLWETVGRPIGGDNHLQSISVPLPAGEAIRYYRLRYETE